ncbi:hypothetical protein EVAR_2954_1 [Eumeta japonica]|uniref:Uncharacterized protein n=1 Tax=Eumeta variegata TaxID=151549 RepID=A0A4C1T114_EUMVA|nr:hypothetical protein EVAR_2954_1 [Eumeta japonica]
MGLFVDGRPQLSIDNTETPTVRRHRHHRRGYGWGTTLKTKKYIQFDARGDVGPVRSGDVCLIDDMSAAPIRHQHVTASVSGEACRAFSCSCASSNVIVGPASV